MHAPRVAVAALATVLLAWIAVTVAREDTHPGTAYIEQELADEEPSSFAAAITDPGISTLVLRGDYQLKPDNWDGVPRPYLVQRNITITSDDPNGYYLLDFNFMSGWILLGDDVTVELSHVVLNGTRYTAVSVPW
jgi:hypothetical protein